MPLTPAERKRRWRARDPQHARDVDRRYERSPKGYAAKTIRNSRNYAERRLAAHGIHI